MMPSRQFLTAQAVLNATKLYEADIFRCLGTNVALRCMCSKDFTWTRPDFVKIIQACFRDLVSQYEPSEGPHKGGAA